MFEMLIFGLGIFELKLATLELELAILLGIFESELGIFGLKLATLEPELAILLGILEPEHVILETPFYSETNAPPSLHLPNNRYDLPMPHVQLYELGGHLGEYCPS